MNRSLITQELLQYIAGAFYISSVDDIDLDISLIKQEVIDSMGLLEIATFVQQRFNFPVSEKELNQENFGSINLITNYIISKTMAEAQ